MTEDEAITVTLALIAGTYPWVVRRQVERLEHLLPDVGWSAHMVRAGFATMAAPAASSHILARRDQLRRYAEEAGASLRWWPKHGKLVLDLGDPGTDDVIEQVNQVMQAEKDIAHILGRSTEVLMAGSTFVREADPAELEAL